MAWTVAVLIVAAVAVGPAVAKEIEEPQSYDNVDDLTITDTELISEEEVSRKLPTTYHPSSNTCESVGGKCMSKKEAKKECKGKIVKTLECPEAKDVCWINGCSEDAGFFWLASSGQCFKLMTDNYGLNWTDAKALCEEKKLKLAHPYNVIDLHSYMTQRYGKYSAFLNARGNGEAIIWQDNGAEIGNDSPLWREDAPFEGVVDDTKCLMIGTWPTKFDTNKPYWATPCVWWRSYRCPLCEMDINMLE